jgi:cell division protein FtsL
LHEKVLELREKRLDVEEVISEIQKSIEDLKKTIDRLKQREKQIAKDSTQTEYEVRLFQLQKQAALNQVEVIVPLSISQLYCFEDSGSLTGPTDKAFSASFTAAAAASATATAAAAAAAAMAEATTSNPENTTTHLDATAALAATTATTTTMTSTMTTLKQDVPSPLEGSHLFELEKRKLVPDVTMETHVLFSKSAMLQLQSRIGELHEEIEDSRLNFKELHKERVRLNKEREIRRAEIESWEKRCRDLQMLKFGRVTDLDELEAGSDRTKEHEAESIVKLVEDRGRLGEYKLRREMEDLEEQLAQLTVKNTELLNVLATLTEAKLRITRELNDSKSGPTVSHDVKQTDRMALEERQHLKAYVDVQSKEIAALQAEITMLKRKDIPPLPNTLMSNSQPVSVSAD